MSKGKFKELLLYHDDYKPCKTSICYNFFSRAICQCMLCTVRACTYTNKLITANNFLPFTRACSFAYPLEIHERIILDVCRRTLIRYTPVIDDRFSSYEQTWLKSATHINSRHQPEGVFYSALGGIKVTCMPILQTCLHRSRAADEKHMSVPSCTCRCSVYPVIEVP